MEKVGHFLNELCTAGIVYRSRNFRLCIIMLKHEVMVADEWHNNGPQDLVMVSLCIQIAFDKIKLCSLSVVYAHTTPCRQSAICPVQLKMGKAHFSSVPMAIEDEHLPTEVDYEAELQSCEDHGEDDEHADQLP